MALAPDVLGRAVFLPTNGLAFPRIETADGPVAACFRCGGVVPLDEYGLALLADLKHREGCELTKAAESKSARGRVIVLYAPPPAPGGAEQE